MKNWQAVAIPTESDLLTEALGLTDDRIEILRKIGHKALSEFEITSESLEYATGECNNINEAVYISFLIGAFQEHKRNKDMGMFPEPHGMINEICKIIAKKTGGKYMGSFEIDMDDDDDK